jgi:translocation and assembly module TamB
MPKLRTLLLATGLVAAALQPVLAQETEQEARGRLTGFVEDQISSPNRIIRLGSIDGILSSDVRIDQITVADREGVYLRIVGAHLVWSRLALLTGTLDIDLLEAEQIIFERPPVPDEEAAAFDPAASGPFRLPELPVSLLIDQITVPQVSLGEALVGEAAELSIDGNIYLENGELDSALLVERLDDPGGRFDFSATYGNESGILDLDLTYDEPPGGLVAKLLNVQGEPALTFVVNGTGPLDNFAADISLAADGTTLVTGTGSAAQGPEGLRILADVNGNLAPLVSTAYDDFVAGQSTLDIDALRATDGSFEIRQASVRSGVLALDLTGRLAPDGFPTAINVDGSVTSGGAADVALSTSSRLGAATFNVAFGGDGDAWSAEFLVQELQTETLQITEATVRAGGTATNLASPADRMLTFDVDAGVNGFSSGDADLARALGGAFTLVSSGSWQAGDPVAVDRFTFTNRNASASFSGQYGDDGLDGTYTINAADISAFSGVAGRELAGAVDLRAEGNIFPVAGTFALRLAGGANDLAIGMPTVDPLLAGRTELGGVLSRSEDGLHFTDLSVENAQIGANLEGTYGAETTGIVLTSELSDLALVTTEASGAVTLNAQLRGPNADPDIQATIAGPSLTVRGTPFLNARIGFDGQLPEGDVAGLVTASGEIGGVRLDGSADVATLDGAPSRITGLTVTAGETNLQGDLIFTPDGLVTGALMASSPDLSVIAPLLLVDAAGAIDADITLTTTTEGAQNATVSANARGLRFEANSVESAVVDLDAEDLFGVPAIDGRFTATGIAAGGITVDRVEGTATRSGTTTAFDLSAELAAGAATATGSLAPVDDGFDLALDSFTFSREPDLSARLLRPARLSLRGEDISISDAEIAVGNGRIRASGTAGETIDLDVLVDALPLSLANAVAPDLGLSGTLSGSLNATGTRAEPVVAFDVTGAAITATPLRNAGIEPLAISATGRHVGGATEIDARTTIGGGAVRVTGSVGEALDLAATVTNLPLSLANAVSPGLGASGTLSATATVAGTPAAPVVIFDATGNALSVAALRSAGIGALALSADGRFENNAVTLDASASAAGGIAVDASGRVPLAGSGLALDVSGTLPLSAANPALATRGARLDGTVTLDARVTGSLAAPAVSGSASSSGASFADPETGTRLEGITIAVDFTGAEARIRQLTAGTNGGGTIGVTGTIGFAPGSNLPINLAVALGRARITDGDLFAAEVSGNLAIGGSLLGVPSVSGDLTIDRAEVTIPESFPASAALLDVRHRLPPPNVRATIERARLSTGGGAADSGGGFSALTLDVRVNAPARVFVRGRGVDAEVGGSITLQGPISNVVPIGSFELIRGRLDIIGQRIEFESGSVTLVGDLDPFVNLVATSRSNNITVTVTVTGRVSDLQIELASSPQLPQDEILAQFLFGKGIDELSPFQIVRLTAAVAQLAGGGGGGLLGDIRGAGGLDDFDIVTDAEGGVGVQAGRYISDNVYLGVTAGATGARVSVDLDLTEDVKARVEAGDNGASVGVFYEREY